jgi:predicted alpha/beta superfamily hydrolase
VTTNHLIIAFLLTTAPLAAQTSSSDPAPDPIPPHQGFTIDSKVLAERRLVNVYTPAGYETAPGVAYPVLFMLDGGLEEDFPHVVNTVDSLIRLEVIRPVLVVGIENTERRRDLTGPTTVGKDSTIAPHVGGSAAFRRFFRDEFLPEVKARYRTTEETTIVGESLAGLWIVETFLLEPNLFQRYIALDPSLWWNRAELVTSADSKLKNLKGTKRTLFLSSAVDEDIVANTANLAATLKSAPAGLTLYYEPRPDLTHMTIFRGEGPKAFATVLK